MKNVVIDTSYPCVIKTASSQKFLDTYSFAKLENESTFEVYPTNKQGVYPFSVDINKLNANENFKYYENGNTIYISLNLPSQVESFNLEKINYKNKVVIFKISKNKLKIQSDNKSYTLLLNPYEYYSINKTNGFVNVLFSGNNQSFLASICVDNEKLFTFKGKEIKLDKDLIFVINDTKSTYICKDNDIKLAKNELASYFVNEKTLGLVFLNAIKKHQFSVARSFLSETLQEKNEDDLS